MNKIKKLIDELQEEVEKKTGIKPDIEINLHASHNSCRKEMTLLQAHSIIENLKSDLSLKPTFESFRFRQTYDDEPYSEISLSDYNKNLNISLYFGDRRNKIAYN